MRIFVLDDCEILRLSISIVLKDEERITCVETGDSRDDVCKRILKSGCDTLLVGLRLRNTNALEIARQLRTAGANFCIVALGFSTDLNDVQAMYQAGIDSFVSLSCDNDELVGSVLSARRKQHTCDFSITASYDNTLMLP